MLLAVILLGRVFRAAKQRLDRLGHAFGVLHLASAYDFAEQLLTSQAEYAEGMTEAIRPLLGGTKDAAKKDDSK